MFLSLYLILKMMMVIKNNRCFYLKFRFFFFLLIFNILVNVLFRRLFIILLDVFIFFWRGEFLLLLDFGEDKCLFIKIWFFLFFWIVFVVGFFGLGVIGGGIFLSEISFIILISLLIIFFRIWFVITFVSLFCFFVFFSNFLTFWLVLLISLFKFCFLVIFGFFLDLLVILLVFRWLIFLGVGVGVGIRLFLGIKMSNFGW